MARHNTHLKKEFYKPSGRCTTKALVRTGRASTSARVAASCAESLADE
jgi:hypothetical protein